MDLESVRAQLEILSYVQSQRAMLKDMEESAKAAVQEALGENEIGALDGKIVVTWKHVKSMRLNQKAFREKLPDVHALYSEYTESRRFMVES
jgi:predicted phage-related endonuclease